MADNNVLSTFCGSVFEPQVFIKHICDKNKNKVCIIKWLNYFNSSFTTVFSAAFFGSSYEALNYIEKEIFRCRLNSFT